MRILRADVTQAGDSDPEWVSHSHPHRRSFTIQASGGRGSVPPNVLGDPDAVSPCSAQRAAPASEDGRLPPGENPRTCIRAFFCDSFPSRRLLAGCALPGCGPDTGRVTSLGSGARWSLWSDPAPPLQKPLQTVGKDVAASLQ